MLELEEWQGEVFESLSTLKISNCPKLKKMPRPFLNLRVLKIKKCASLETVPFSGAMFVKLVDNPVLKHWPEVTLVSVVQGVTRHLNFSASHLLEVNIIHCPELRSLPRNICPQKLELSGCMSLRSLPDQRCSGRLQVLALDACPDETLVSMIPGTGSLYSLAVSNISNFICLPKWPSLPGLKALYISNCGDLEYLINQENRTLFNGFTSLQLLSIQKCPKLVTLPVEGLPTSLQVLIISSCASLESFGAPEVLKNLTSLHDLYIEDCQALQSLPGDGLPTSLQHLSIQSCPSLIAQCEKEDGDLPKIEGIADREIKPSTRTATSS
ncbi:putative disease resistance protein [Prunus yedoensis var. nudiflora]|uniref:Putative disease resistance protein n=1 Tax=Prunus yedoensis var. nudiflora TaxID=2094558 RepID=A0A314UW93_PRUYE|nr:putative disease resistance protein [Prunus yedoensis var. nudiflora]